MPDFISQLTSPDMLHDRYPLYTEMRQLRPVFNISEDRLWLIFGYDNVRLVLSDSRQFSSDFRRSISPLNEEDFLAMVSRNASAGRGSSLIGTDPPIHRQLRDLVSRAFTPTAIDALAPRIEALVNEMIDQVITKGQFDLIKDLAYPLPVIVIAEMLGIPAEDREQFKQWSDLVMASTNQFLGKVSRDEARAQVNANWQMSQYFHKIIADRRSKPCDDMISALIAAELNGQRLSESNVVTFCTLLLVAGNVPTTNLIGNAMCLLLQNPGEMDRLRQDLSLLPSAIEEVLRYASPAQAMYRYATRDVQIENKTIQRGDRVIAFIGSANRDEKKFSGADRFDITRDPNPHIAFGFGVHYCLGAPLARLEARITLTALLQRMQNLIRSDTNSLDYKKEFLVQGVSALPLYFTPVLTQQS